MEFIAVRQLVRVYTLLAHPPYGRPFVACPALLAGPSPQTCPRGMKPQLHRSLTFWSGILIMVFICWAWWDSLQYLTMARYHHAYVQQGGGGLASGFFGSSGSDWFSLRKKVSTHAALVDGDIRFISTAHQNDSKLALPEPLLTNRTEGVEAFVPYWLILLAVATPWVALLLWRARHRSRSKAR